MSEPTTRAERMNEVVAGVLHWSVLDDRIGFRSEAFAVETSHGLVAIDPLPLARSLRGRLGDLRFVCITGAFHQRSAWRFRREHAVPVYAPRDAVGLDEQPDGRYGDDEQPVPGLTAIESHGPTNPHFILKRLTDEGLSVVFCGDLLMRADVGPFSLVPDEHHEDVERTRRAARALLGMSIDLLCPAHGNPLVGGVEAAVREALGRKD